MRLNRMSGVIAAVVVVGVIAAYSFGIPASNAPPTTASTATASATAGGLRVSLAASPTRIQSGQAVIIQLDAEEQHATGALLYQVFFGDGITNGNLGPTFCRAGPGSPDTVTWWLSHGYGRAGTYRVSARVQANCSGDQAATSVIVAVS